METIRRTVFVWVAVLYIVISLSCKPAPGGEVAAWGNNNYGQCDVPANNNFVAVAAG